MSLQSRRTPTVLKYSMPREIVSTNHYFAVKEPQYISVDVIWDQYVYIYIYNITGVLPIVNHEIIKDTIWQYYIVRHLCTYYIFCVRDYFRGGNGMAGGWMGVGTRFDGLVRRWRRSAGRPHTAGGCRYAARTNAVLYRHLLYARVGAAQRTRRSVPAASNRHGRRLVQVVNALNFFRTSNSN